VIFWVDRIWKGKKKKKKPCEESAKISQFMHHCTEWMKISQQKTEKVLQKKDKRSPCVPEMKWNENVSWLSNRSSVHSSQMSVLPVSLDGILYLFCRIISSTENAC
jgi:hypothetical protein